MQPGSPCVDAGDSSLVVAGSLDMDGQPRIQGSSVDIGADESYGTLWSTNPTVLYVSPSGSDNNDGSSWAKAKKTVQAGIDAASNVGGDVWVAAGVYAERVTLQDPTAISTAALRGNETSGSQRNFAANKSIIDGSGGGNIMTSGVPGTIAGIDGFTIRNSGASYNGISCSSSSPAISNNTISGNGRGIYCSSSNPVISDNTVVGNVLGIVCSSSSPAIINNTITGNNQYGIYALSLNP